jgi:hypothetical protein
MPFVDTAWLSQLFAYGAYSAYGVAAIQFLYGAAITLAAGLLLWRSYNRTGNAVFSVAGLSLFMWVEWQQFLIVRPQLAGVVCFILLLTILTGRKWSRINWVAIPAMFAVWANMHGSFPVGLALLVCFCAGRAFDVFRRTRKPAAILFDKQVRRYFVLAELAAAAALLNPYGLGVYIEAFAVSGNANLVDLVEWQALHLRLSQGQAAAAAALALIIVYRFSPRRVASTELLLLAGFGGLALWTSRMLLWWAPLAAYYFALHASAAWNHARRNRFAPKPSPRTGKWSVITAGIVWICLALSPIFGVVVHGTEHDFEKSVSPYTPIAAVEYLRKNPPHGQVFNTYEWGDYLLWAGPQGLQVFVNSHAHLVPTEVWQQYLRISNMAAGWEDALDRYGVNTIIIDHRFRSEFIHELKGNSNWKLGFEDDRAAVFTRVKPI